MIFQYTNNAETSKKTWKKKKYSRQNRKTNQKNISSATGVNTTDNLKQSYDRSKKYD